MNNFPEKDAKADSFVEKMASQVIKNLQVKVSDIHMRYEDKTTNTNAPFSIGTTLHNVSLKVRTGCCRWGVFTYLFIYTKPPKMEKMKIHKTYIKGTYTRVLKETGSNPVTLIDDPRP